MAPQQAATPAHFTGNLRLRCTALLAMAARAAAPGTAAGKVRVT
ncbi:hypothetical protein ACOVJL_06020 [Scardovia wiggsiae]